jgi:PAS domain S-box-containing protein
VPGAVRRTRTSGSPAATIRRLRQALSTLTGVSPELRDRARAEVLLAHLAKVPVAILVANNAARYIEVNRAAVGLTRYSRAELMRMNLGRITPSSREPLGTRLWRDFLTRGRMAGRYELRRKDGTTVLVRYVAFANVLPGLHVSALVPVRPRAPRRKSPTRKRPRDVRPSTR